METPLQRNCAQENHAVDGTGTSSHSIHSLSDISAKVPPKSLLKSLYELAMENKESHQYDLTMSCSGNCVVLSLEDVWLPSVVYQVQHGLKAIESKIKRDGTEEQIETVKNARIHLMRQVLRSREILQNQRRFREEQYRCRMQQEKDRQAMEIKNEARRQQETHRRNHPYNQELWREVGSLIKEMQALEEEEKLWDETLKHLPTRLEFTLGQEDDKYSSMEVEYNTNISPVTEELASSANMMDDLQQWIQQVRNSLAQIHPAMEQVEALRSELFRQHQSSRFKGYPGVRQPKDLLRILSQDPDDDLS